MITKKVIELENGSELLLEVLDARTIKVSTFPSIPEIPINFSIENNNEKSISKILANNVVIADLNSSSKTVKIPITEQFVSNYVITSIEQAETKESFYFNTFKRTTASYFLPAFVSSSRAELAWDRYFVNAYFVNLNDNNYTIGLLYRFFPVETFYELERKLKTLEAFHDSYNCSDQHIMFTFNVKDKDVKDLKTLLNSKYSQLSNSMKTRVLKFHNYSDDSYLGKVLNKHDSLRRQLQMEFNVEYIGTAYELYEAIDLEREVILYMDDPK